MTAAERATDAALAGAADHRAATVDLPAPDNPEQPTADLYRQLDDFAADLAGIKARANRLAAATVIRPNVNLQIASLQFALSAAHAAITRARLRLSEEMNPASPDGAR